MTSAVTLPPDIHQLSDDIANKIAAGEVIERPAAVVKELVENSLDAGARRVLVRIEEGGKRLIEVIDDGHGMRPEGLRAAIGRHATSKLRAPEDLFAVATLGFRGEALPSIAAVSECELASRPHDQADGHRLRIGGGQDVKDAPCAMPAGTSVRVRNLFWNVPVRLKFLRSDQSESGHITDMVHRLALGHPEVAFTLQIGERSVLDLPPGQQLPDRVRQLFGGEMGDALLPVAVHTDVCALGGFVAHPSLARPTAKRQFMYLNGRHVKDKLLVAALREGYKGFLEPRLHPAVYLTLDCEPQLVDVNVHPTKAEVRFRRSREVFGLIKRGLQECLQEHVGGFGLLGGREVGSGEGQSASRRSASFDLPGYRNESRNESRGEGGIVARHVVKPAADPALQERFLPRSPEIAPEVAAGRSIDASRSAAALPADGAPVEPAHSAYASAQDAADGLNEAAAASAPDRVAEQRVRWDEDAASDLPGVRRIVQLHDMYLLIETDHGIRLVDQHALHEKAIFLCLDPERTDVHGAGRQELLTPIVVECGASDLGMLEPLFPALADYGILVEEFGPGSLAVRAFPAILRKTNWSRFFSDLVESGDATRAVDDLRERIAHRASCRSAVKAGDVLSAAEQRELVRLLYTLEGTEHCPHGRPTTLDLTWGELERRFQR